MHMCMNKQELSQKNFYIAFHTYHFHCICKSLPDISYSMCPDHPACLRP